ncbi:hypothetical protein J6590_082793 [Homalodisca vitripennis]|nr:hypothetical protein J6590_082793 [Homalodisca vitripennis]
MQLNRQTTISAAVREAVKEARPSSYPSINDTPRLFVTVSEMSDRNEVKINQRESRVVSMSQRLDKLKGCYDYLFLISIKMLIMLFDNFCLYDINTTQNEAVVERVESMLQFTFLLVQRLQSDAVLG